MELILKKNNPTDPSTITSTDLLGEYIKKEGVNKLISEYINDIIKEYKQCNRKNIENSMQESNIFSINVPLNSTLLNTIEQTVNIPGCIYYDPINDVFRGRKKDKWMTLNLI